MGTAGVDFCNCDRFPFPHDFTEYCPKAVQPQPVTFEALKERLRNRLAPGAQFAQSCADELEALEQQVQALRDRIARSSWPGAREFIQDIVVRMDALLGKP